MVGVHNHGSLAERRLEREPQARGAVMRQEGLKVPTNKQPKRATCGSTMVLVCVWNPNFPNMFGR